MADRVAADIGVAIQPIQDRIGAGELAQRRVVVARAVVVQPVVASAVGR